MEHKVKQFGWKRNLEYIGINFKLSIKNLFEYKINLLFGVLDFVTYFVTQFLLIKIIASNFGDVINWSLQDFMLLLVLVNFIWISTGIFKWGEVLFSILKLGNLNQLLSKPNNNLVKIYFYNIDAEGLLFILFSLLYSFFIINYYNIVLYNFYFGFNMVVLVGLYFLLFVLTLDSVNLINLGSSYIFNPIVESQDRIQNYSSKFFQKTKYRFFLNIMPVYFASSLLVPIFMNHSVNYYFQILLLFSLILIFLILFLRIWHYGLKKYEAFG